MAVGFSAKTSKVGKSIRGNKETTPKGKPSFVHKVTNKTTIPMRAECIGLVKTVFASKPLVKAKIIASIIADTEGELILTTMFI